MAFPKKDPNLQPLAIGTPAPDFSLPACGVPAGTEVSLEVTEKGQGNLGLK
jgi:hypothetical protein